MGDRKLRYIVNAPSFDPDSGGTIFLHELAHTLNSLGEEAYVWPMAPIFRQGVKSRLWSLISRPAFDTSPSLNTPLAHKRMFNAPDTVVVYPEIVPGNPMGAQNVVRWLLYKPGDQHPYSFTEGEMFFRCYEKADLVEVTGGTLCARVTESRACLKRKPKTRSISTECHMPRSTRSSIVASGSILMTRPRCIRNLRYCLAASA